MTVPKTLEELEAEGLAHQVEQPGFSTIALDRDGNAAHVAPFQPDEPGHPDYVDPKVKAAEDLARQIEEAKAAEEAKAKASQKK